MAKSTNKTAVLVQMTDSTAEYLKKQSQKIRQTQGEFVGVSTIARAVLGALAEAKLSLEHLPTEYQLRAFMSEVIARGTK